MTTTKGAPKASPAAMGQGKKAESSAKAKAKTAKAKTASAPKERAPSRGDTMIALMREEGGATAQALAEAVGWQLHSVRGFISGTLKKRADLKVASERVDGVTRYSVVSVEAASE
ncbi:MAG: DUF3489 domain-containing protein [Alphaproteobacteria bacterium]|nr:MAG: DUF3489 domain-containing protein [Alphaproteobacteria bacterium]